MRRACELEPANVQYLDTYSVLLSEVGPREEALAVLQRLVELAPDQGFEKYMYLGQLLEGDEAVSNIRKAVSLLEQQLADALERRASGANASGSGGAAGETGMREGDAAEARGDAGETDSEVEEEDEVDGAKRMLSDALCSLCEVLLCGASDPEQVAGECEEVLARARGVCPDTPEPLQKLAVLRLQQGRREEALDALRQSLATWYKPRRQPGDVGGAADPAEGGMVADESDEEELDEDYGELPPLGARLEVVKLLLELDDTTTAALDVAETCLLEDEDSVEATFLMAMVHHASGNLDEASTTLDEAFELAMHQGLAHGHVALEPLKELRAAIEESKAA